MTPDLQESQDQTNLPTSSPSNASKPVEKRIHLLFAKFATFYGHIWKSQFKEEKVFIFAKAQWQKVLEEFDEAVLNQAIFSCLETHEMPPTLPQFLKICLRFKKDVEARLQKPETPYVRGSLEIAKNNVNTMYMYLGMSAKHPTVNR